MAKKIPKYINPLISFLHFAVRNLPTKKASALMAFVLTKGSNIFVKSHNMRTNIRYIFPNMEETKVEEIAQQMLANFGRHIAEIAHISDFRYDQKGARIDTVMANGLAFDGKGPAIYVGAHVGSWELSALIFDKQKCETDSPRSRGCLLSPSASTHFSSMFTLATAAPVANSWTLSLAMPKIPLYRTSKHKPTSPMSCPAATV